MPCYCSSIHYQISSLRRWRKTDAKSKSKDTTILAQNILLPLPVTLYMHYKNYLLASRNKIQKSINSTSISYVKTGLCVFEVAKLPSFSQPSEVAPKEASETLQSKNNPISCSDKIESQNAHCTGLVCNMGPIKAKVFRNNPLHVG